MATVKLTKEISFDEFKKAYLHLFPNEAKAKKAYDSASKEVADKKKAEEDAAKVAAGKKPEAAKPAVVKQSF